MIDFPERLHAEDASVNEFLMQAVQTCVEEDYDAFRLLWSAREEPISREEFKRGWQAEPRISITELRRMQTPEGDIVYAVRASVELDPKQVPEPHRDVVMLLVQENDKWRLARAPRSVIKVLRKNAEQESPDAPQGTAAGADEHS